MSALPTQMNIPRLTGENYPRWRQSVQVASLAFGFKKFTEKDPGENELSEAESKSFYSFVKHHVIINGGWSTPSCSRCNSTIEELTPFQMIDRLNKQYTPHHDV
jgi:hypothetical protein